MDSVQYARICRYVSETPWAIQPEVMSVLQGVLRERAGGHRPTAEEVRERIAAQDGDRSGVGRVRSGNVAVLPIHGAIMRRADMLQEISGAVSLERMEARLDEALSDTNVSDIVLHVDSPGGAVDGVPEFAARVRAARGGDKRIVAVADTLAASAAYWIATAADEVTVTPSGEVGSIGVFAAHQDLSGALEQAGVDVTLISAGPYKIEGNPFEPLSEEARSAIQNRIDDYYSMFIEDVAAGRGVSTEAVRSGFGQGRVVGARDALSEGMVDRVETFGDTLARLRNTAQAGNDNRQSRRGRRGATARRRFAFA
ncbi:MAG: S49 family peptidase [Rhodovibrio sp.]|nr:S49 family peptidase [Rhodovibrio sp.]